MNITYIGARAFFAGMVVMAIIAIGAILLSSLFGCTDPNIHLPRDECFQYTLEDGTTVVVWMSEVPTAAEGLPVVKNHGLPFPLDPEEYK